MIRKRKPTNLLDQVITLTGIPGEIIKRELKVILDRKGIDPRKLTLTELRSVVASYLREITCNLLDKGRQGKSDG